MNLPTTGAVAGNAVVVTTTITATTVSLGFAHLVAGVAGSVIASVLLVAGSITLTVWLRVGRADAVSPGDPWAGPAEATFIDTPPAEQRQYGPRDPWGFR